MNIEDINLNEYDCTPVNSVPSARLDLLRKQSADTSSLHPSLPSSSIKKPERSLTSLLNNFKFKTHSLNDIENQLEDEDDDSIKQKRDFLIKLSQALVMYGSPTHRLEHHLNCLSTALNVSSGFFILPGVILISFGIVNLISSSNACFK